MSTFAAVTSETRTWPQRLPFYYGWINVVVAAAAMSATLPGRTHGVGLITEPLLADLKMERTELADINVVCSVLGAAFCIPVGYCIDRFGVRNVLPLVVISLALSVLWMSAATGAASLLGSMLLVRGFGQSALSIVSMAIIGKWFRRRAGIAMGLFTVLMTIGFIATVLGTGAAVGALGWRGTWQAIAAGLLVFAPLGWLFVRSTPEACGIAPDEPASEPQTTGAADAVEFSFAAALATPAFWVIALGTSAYNLTWSGVMMFNESILNEIGFGRDVSVKIMAAMIAPGLIANLVFGKLTTRSRIGSVLGIGLFVLGAGLAAFPSITGMAGIYLYATAMGLAGGIVTVVFFAAWSQLFGRGQLGRIQGTAQLISVLASALGPVLMARYEAFTGTYLPMFYLMATGMGVLALAACFVPLPRQVSVAAIAIKEIQLATAPLPVEE